MTTRENLIRSLEGKKPERIPYTAYVDCGMNGDEFEEILRKGLAETEYVSVVRETRHGVDTSTTKGHWKGLPAEVTSLRTSIGNISQISVNGWVQEYYIKTPQDYRVMEHIIRSSTLEFDPGQWEDGERRIGDRGITLINCRRTPIQTIMVDYVGLERFAYHMADGFPELSALQDALLEQFIEICRLIARGPGRYVHINENMIAETWGPDRFARYHMPVYERIMPILHKGGKKVYAHFDGKLECVADQLARSGIDGIESLTLPPEGDLTYRAARERFPEKFLWSNLSLHLYDLPDDELRRRIREYVGQAAPDGRNLAFGILEDVPALWKTKIPVILDTLAEIVL